MKKLIRRAGFENLVLYIEVVIIVDIQYPLCADIGSGGLS
jgi:hypothetical protein